MGVQAELLNLHHLHCPAWLFSGQGELQCSNRAASGKGDGRTLESLLVQLGFAEPLSDLDTHASCRLDNGTHAVDVLKISSTDKEADAFLVLEGKASTRGTTTCKQAHGQADAVVASAREERLREQLQTLQRKLLNVVARNELLSTRLTGLHSVCLEISEQLQSADVRTRLEPDVGQHLQHLCDTCLSYSDSDTWRGTESFARCASHDDFSAEWDADLLGFSGPAHDSSATVPVPAVLPLPLHLLPDQRSSGHSGHFPGKHPSGCAHAEHTGDYNSLLKSFLALKASYEVLLHQQDTALLHLHSSTTTASPHVASAGDVLPGVQLVDLPNMSSCMSVPQVDGQAQWHSGLQPPWELAEAAATVAAREVHGHGGSSSGRVIGLHGKVGLLGQHGSSGGGAGGAGMSRDASPLGLASATGVGSTVSYGADTAAEELKAQLDKVLLDKVEEKAEFDRVLARTVREAVAMKAVADKAKLDLAEAQGAAATTKAQFDKLVLDKAEEKAEFDRALEHSVQQAAAQKAVADKALLDMGGMQAAAATTKAQFDKFVLDKAEEKAEFDKALQLSTNQAAAQKAIADKAVLDMGEMQASAVAAKAQFDKFVLDKAEEKAEFDRALEHSVEQAAAQKAVADKALLDMGEMQDSAVAAKAQFDKFVLDKAEEKAEFDKALQVSTTQAAAQKAIADKAVLDMGEMQASAVAAKAQFDKFVLDKAEEKAEFDRALEHSVQETAAMRAVADKALLDKGQCEAAAASTKAQFDKFVLDKTEEKAAFDKVLEHTTQEAAAQKAVADKALLDMGEMQAAAVTAKAQFDKFVLDKAEEKAEFDRALEHTVQEAAAQKAVADKALLDMGEMQTAAVTAKAEFDKFVLDKAEEKAEFDKVLQLSTNQAAAQKAIADKALLDVGEAVASAASAKAQFDKFVLDKAEEKAEFDRVLEHTVQEAAAQKAVADKALLDMGEMQASAVAAKAQFDKFVLDKAEEKAEFDKALQLSTNQAAAQKAIADKALLDVGDMQASVVAAKAQFDKFVLDKAEEKAELDKALAHSVQEAAAQKAVADKALLDMGEVEASAASAKAQFDKFVLDKAEEKAEFDRVLEHTVHEAAAHKAVADKALLDMGEMQNAAAASKAQFDKLVLDKAEEKAEFDRALEHSVQQAATQKAVADQALLDMGEMQASAAATKSQLDKALVDMAEEKAGFDRALQVSKAHAAHQKAIADKALVDMGEMESAAAATKAQFDKYVVDQAEEKAAFSKLMQDTAEQAAQHKAVADKAMVDMGELQAVAMATKAQFDKFVTDKAEEKAEFDKVLEHTAQEAAQHKAVADKAMMDMGELQAEAARVAEELAAERAVLDEVQAHNERLLKQQEVLQAELQMALSNYTPKAVIDAGTPADKILAMMTDLLDGSPPSIQDILFVQSAILEAHDVYQPVNLGKQLLQSSMLDNDVGMALLQQLGSHDDARAMNQQQLQQQQKQATQPPAAQAAAPITARACDSLDEVAYSGMDDGRSSGPYGRGGARGLAAAALGGGTGDEDGSYCLNPWANLESSILALIQADSADTVGGAPDPGMPRAASRSLMARVRARAASQGLVHHNSGSGLDSPTSPYAAMHHSASSSCLGPGANGAAPHTALSPLRAGGGRCLERTNTGTNSPVTEVELDEFPEQPIFSEVERVLATSNNWQWDAFKLADATQDHALSTLAFYLFHQADLIRKFDIKPHLLARFFRRVEEGYRPNPYHSKTHAADVMQSFHVIIHRGGLAPGYVDPLTLLSCYLAAVVHDYEHGGLTNDYLINTSDLLAVRYNDRAPLENHHLAAAFTLLRRPEYAFLSHLPKADTDRMRKMVIEMVLATDMKQHFALMSHFTTVHRLGVGTATNTGVTPSLANGTERRRSSSNSSLNSLTGVSANGTGNGELSCDKIYIPLDENERILSLQMALKCSDLGHVSASLPVHCRWVAGLEEEFFRQGDQERQHGLPISPLFDRSKPGVTKSQIGFLDIVVIPLLNNFSRVFTSTKPLLTYAMRNYKYWAEQHKSEQRAAGAGK